MCVCVCVCACHRVHVHAPLGEKRRGEGGGGKEMCRRSFQKQAAEKDLQDCLLEYCLTAEPRRTFYQPALFFLGKQIAHEQCTHPSQCLMSAISPARRHGYGFRYGYGYGYGSAQVYTYGVITCRHDMPDCQFPLRSRMLGVSHPESLTPPSLARAWGQMLLPCALFLSQELIRCFHCQSRIQVTCHVSL